jgi:hypothetical protein
MNYPLGVALLACALLAHANSIRAAVISPGDILATSGITNGATFNATLYRVDPHTATALLFQMSANPCLESTKSPLADPQVAFSQPAMPMAAQFFELTHRPATVR